MIQSTHKIAALIPIRPTTSSESLPCVQPFNNTTVLQATINRLNQCEKLNAIILLVDDISQTQILLADLISDLPIHLHHVTEWDHYRHEVLTTARKFTPTAWRGGLAGATIYDELLDAPNMTRALQQHNATAGLILGPDWPLISPTFTDQIIQRHLDEPEHFKLTFTQAPPGLAPCLIETSLLTELADNGTSIGFVLDYHPTSPQADPIGKDMCVQIPHTVRNAIHRYTYDSPPWQQSINEMLTNLPPNQSLETLTPEQIVEHINAQADTTIRDFTLELTPHRQSDGPITPHHTLNFDREPITLEHAKARIDEIALIPDARLTLGHLGDPLLHPDWESIITYAKQKNIYGLHLETDLLVDQPTLEKLLNLGIDIISVRINADSPQTYQKLMAHDSFDKVLKNIQWLLNQRQSCEVGGIPFIVPRLIKTHENLHELEPFFDRWSHFTQTALIEPHLDGAGQIPSMNPLPLTPPKRIPCRQLNNRITILSNNQPALCDQHWQATPKTNFPGILKLNPGTNPNPGTPNPTNPETTADSNSDTATLTQNKSETSPTLSLSVIQQNQQTVYENHCNEDYSDHRCAECNYWYRA